MSSFKKIYKDNVVKISVITGTYNPGHLFHKFIESILKQTLTDLELIIIDDCSIDGTREIIQEYANQDTRIKVILNEKNLGISETYNKGLELASGEYVSLVDSDDFLDLDFYEKMYNFSMKNDLDLCLGYSITHFSGNVDYLPAYIFGNVNDGLWAQLFKRTTLINNNIRYKNVLFEDVQITNDVKSIKGARVLKLPLEEATFYHYIRHNNNTSSKYITDKDNIEKPIETLVKISDNILEMEKRIRSDLATMESLNLRFMRLLDKDIIKNLSEESKQELRQILKEKTQLDQYSEENLNVDKFKLV